MKSLFSGVVALLSLPVFLLAQSAEQPGLPGAGRVVWKLDLLKQGPVRLVKSSQLAGRPVARLVLEFTRDLDSEEILFLAGNLGAEALRRGPITVTLLDADGVGLRQVAPSYEGFPSRPRRGDRFRLIIPLPPDLWPQTASVVLEWNLPRPAALPSEISPRRP